MEDDKGGTGPLLEKKPSQATKDDLLQAFRLNRMKQMKLERLTRYNNKVKEQIKQDRIKASNSALMVIDYMETNEDKLIPTIWGEEENNRYKTANNNHSKINMITEKEGNLNSDTDCCVIM